MFEESNEHYLKAIFCLKQSKGKIRRVDLADYMGYSKPSITVAVSRLIEKGLLTATRDGYLNLTETGLEASRHVVEKYRFFTELLISCGVEQATAEREACGLEHVLSDESFRRLMERVRVEK